MSLMGREPESTRDEGEVEPDAARRRVTPAALERRQHGHELFEAARRAGFTGAAQRTLEEELWRYSLPVVLHMIRTGKIVEHCARHGRHIELTDAAREVLHVSQDERDALAVDTIAAALPFFTSKVLAQQGWRSDGASIHTFFIGAIAFIFPRVYLVWHREWSKSVHSVGSTLDLASVIDRLGASGWIGDIAEQAALRDTITRILQQADEQTTAICAGIAAGKTYAEIGDQLHLSIKTVEGRMYRLRQTARRMARRGEIHAPALLKGQPAGAR